MTLKLFSVGDIELIHMQIIDASGGSHGTRDRDRLESVVASQTQKIFGEVLYKGLHEKAAAIARGIIADHPLVDGNKRTGIMAALIFLERNGAKTHVQNQHLEDFAVEIATAKLGVPAITAWLQQNTQ